MRINGRQILAYIDQQALSRKAGKPQRTVYERRQEEKDRKENAASMRIAADPELSKYFEHQSQTDWCKFLEMVNKQSFEDALEKFRKMKKTKDKARDLV